MPVDSRRIQGPESAISYIHFLQRRLEKLVLKGERKDGRDAREARPLFLKTGPVSQAKGSAYIEQGNTKVICAVYGPREVTKASEFSLKGQLACEFKFAPFSCKVKKGHQPDNEEVELSKTLQEALEPVVCLHLLPKALVEVNILVLENDGSVLAASLTCASLALADGNIPMYDMAVGSCLLQRQMSDVVLLDPTLEEEWDPADSEVMERNSNMMLGYMPSLQQVTTLLHEGTIAVEDLNNGMEVLIQNCKEVIPLIQDCLKESVEKQLSRK